MQNTQHNAVGHGRLKTDSSTETFNMHYPTSNQLPLCPENNQIDGSIKPWKFSPSNLLDLCLKESKRPREFPQPLVLDPHKRSLCPKCNSAYPVRTASSSQSKWTGKVHQEGSLTERSFEEQRRRVLLHTVGTPRNKIKEQSITIPEINRISKLESRIEVLTKENEELRAGLIGDRYWPHCAGGCKGRAGFEKLNDDVKSMKKQPGNQLGKSTIGTNDDWANPSREIDVKLEGRSCQSYNPSTAMKASMEPASYKTNERKDSKLEFPNTWYSSGASLLDAIIDEEASESRNQLHKLQVQRKQHLDRFVSTETDIAEQDIQCFRTKILALEKQLQQSNEHWWDLWEDNCSVRVMLEQQKREKEALKHENIILQRQLQDIKEEIDILQLNQQLWKSTRYQDVTSSMRDVMNQNNVKSRDELCRESNGSFYVGQSWTAIDEHVSSTIRLYERLLDARQTSHAEDLHQRIVVIDQKTNCQHENLEACQYPSRFSVSDSEHVGQRSELISDEEMPLATKRETPHESADSISSFPPLFIDISECNELERCNREKDANKPSSWGAESSLKDHQINTLCTIDKSSGRHCATESDGLHVSESHALTQRSSRQRIEEYIVMNNVGLIAHEERQSVLDRRDDLSYSRCSEDIDYIRVGPAFDSFPPPTKMGGKVYDLTFRENSIGIHFQKAPARYNCDSVQLTPTIRIDNSRDMESCKRVGVTRDIVLVCGYTEFDRNSTVRPKLGARLVAFNGISVETNNWTFNKVRESIKSCGRPITLSFRDDFLTKEQREIVVNAIADIEEATASLRPRACSPTNSIRALPSDETIYFSNDCDESDDVGSWSASSRGNASYNLC